MSQQSHLGKPFRIPDPGVTVEEPAINVGLHLERIRPSASEAPFIEDTNRDPDEKPFTQAVKGDHNSEPHGLYVQRLRDRFLPGTNTDEGLFYDGSGRPTMPHGTPAFRSARATHCPPQIASCGEGHVAIPKTENITLGQRDESSQNHIISFAHELRKASKQNRSSLLSETGSNTLNASGSTWRSPNITSAAIREETIASDNRQHSFLKPATPPRIRFIGPRTVGQRLEYILADRSKERVQPEPIYQLDSPRPLPYRIPRGTYRLPIDDSNQPFPAPIPLIHNLPLRREIQSPKPTVANSWSGDPKNDSPIKGLLQNNEQNITGLMSVINKLLTCRKLRQFALISFTLKHQYFMQPSLSKPKLHELHLRVTWSTSFVEYPRGANTKMPDSTPTSLGNHSPSLLRVDFLVPVLFLRVFSFLETPIRILAKLYSAVNILTKSVISVIVVFLLWVVRAIQADKLGT